MSSSAPLTRSQSIEKLRDLIKKIDFAQFTTLGAESGRLRSRPMSTQEAEFDGELWFFTYDDSRKVRDIQANPQVSLGYSDPGRQLYVSASGIASLSYDRAKMEQFWQPPLKIYFPDGLDTPGLALLRVEVDEAEYWESDGKIASLIQMAKGLVTGQEADLGENRKITL